MTHIITVTTKKDNKLFFKTEPISEDNIDIVYDVLRAGLDIDEDYFDVTVEDIVEA